MADKNLTIGQRINKVMSELSYVRKTKKVQNYMAVTHDEVISKVHPLLVKHGIIIVPKIAESSFSPSGMVTSSNNPIMLFQSVWDILFVSTDDINEAVTVRVAAHANDTSDKAPGKAASYAVKTAILKLFALETGEEEEERVEGNAAPLSEEQIEQLEELCSELGFPAEETLNNLAVKVYRYDSIKDVPGTAFDNAMKRLKKKAADAKRNASKSNNKSSEKKVDF